VPVHPADCQITQIGDGVGSPQLEERNTESGQPKEGDEYEAGGAIHPAIIAEGTFHSEVPIDRDKSGAPWCAYTECYQSDSVDAAQHRREQPISGQREDATHTEQEAAHEVRAEAQII